MYFIKPINIKSLIILHINYCNWYNWYNKTTEVGDKNDNKQSVYNAHTSIHC